MNIASDGSASTPPADTTSEPSGATGHSTDNEQPTDKGEKVVEETPKDQPDTADQAKDQAKDPNAGDATAESESKPEHTTQTGGWLSWLYRSATGKDPSADSKPAKTSTEPPVIDRTVKEDTSETANQEPEEGERSKTDTPETTEVPVTPQKLSWFQMWYGGSSASKGSGEPKKEEEPKQQDPPKDSVPNTVDKSTDSAPDATPASNEEPERANSPPRTPVQNPRSSGWSFWFRDTSKDSTQAKPQDAESAEASIKQDAPSLQLKPEQKSEPEQEVEIQRKGSSKVKPPKDGTGPAVVPDRVAAQMELSTNALPPKAPEASASRNLQKILPNQILPRFQETFGMQETPSLLQSIGRFLNYSKDSSNKHVNRIRDPPRIRKALAIGVHGYFPAPLIRSVFGQPTGTSIRFSSMAADAIKTWTESRGYTCDIEKIALEGEGRISERVDLLWKLLLNWMEEIRKADYIMIACHSQGVPVAIMLVAKLIAFGCLSASRVGICAMAGVNMGPFPDYRSRWISGSAGELFEFALPHSRVSKDYEAALKCALDFGVRISYIGSIDDQLVSLEVLPQ